ncbi:MAG: LCP family protein [Eubacterium sp.]|nr:LCP family protein [Eubacterium sp.]
MGIFNRQKRDRDDRYEEDRDRRYSRDDYDRDSHSSDSYDRDTRSRDDRGRVYRDAKDIENRRRAKTTDRTDADLYGRKTRARSQRDFADHDEIDRQIDRRYGRESYDRDRRMSDADRSPLTREEMNRKKAGKKRLVVKIAVFVVLLVVAIGLGAILYVQAMLGKIGRVNETLPWVSVSDETFEKDTSEADTIDASDIDLDTSDIELMKDNDVKNILLIGQDQRSDEKSRARSDTMIICSINTKNHKVILSSLMRDMYVNIPGYSANKINASYAFGGMELLDETIEKNFGVPIDGNVEVNLDGFIEAMTVVGNLNIELNAEEAEYINSHNYYGTSDDEWQFDQDWTLHEGMNEMTPSQVLAYSRIRYVGNSDWERTQRQRTVIMTAFKKVMEEKDLGKILELCDKIFPYLSTDMDDKEILSYVKTIVTEDMSTIDDYRIPVDGSWDSEVIRGMSCLVPNLTYNSSMLKHYIYDTAIDEDSKDSGEYTTDQADDSERESSVKETETMNSANTTKTAAGTRTSESTQTRTPAAGQNTANGGNAANAGGANTGNAGGANNASAGNTANAANTSNTGAQNGETAVAEYSGAAAETGTENVSTTDPAASGGTTTPGASETPGTAGGGTVQPNSGSSSSGTSSASSATTYGANGVVTNPVQQENSAE